jgi:hypothetical protein
MEQAGARIANRQAVLRTVDNFEELRRAVQKVEHLRKEKEQ